LRNRCSAVGSEGHEPRRLYLRAFRLLRRRWREIAALTPYPKTKPKITSDSSSIPAVQADISTRPTKVDRRFRWWNYGAMKDYLTSIEKLRTDAAEAALIRDLATDKKKRELYQKLYEHFLRLAAEVEQAVNAGKTAQS
jgi:hypothetical protein